MTTWRDTYDGLSESWRELVDDAHARWNGVVAADPERFRVQTEAFSALLIDWRRELVRIQVAIPSLPPEKRDLAWKQYAIIQQRWQNMAAPFFANVSKPPTDAKIGNPLLLLIGVGIVAVVAICWCLTQSTSATADVEATKAYRAYVETCAGLTRDGHPCDVAAPTAKTLAPHAEEPTWMGDLGKLAAGLISVLVLGGIAAVVIPKVLK